MASSGIIKGSLFALLAFFFMAIFGVLTKMALEGSSPVWVSFIAYLTGAILLAFWILPQGFAYLRSEHYGYLIGRAVFGTTASFLYTLSIQTIPIVNGTLLFNTAPIFIPLLAVFWLKKNVDLLVWLAVILGFAGIIVIIKPTAEIFSQTGDLLALCSGLCLAIAYLLMKLLTATDPAVRIIFYYLGIGTLMQLPLLFVADKVPGAEHILYAMISGVTLLAAQLALIKAYTYADASQVGIYQYSSVVFVGLIGWWMWGNIPPISDLFGVLLVAVAGMVIIRSGMAAKS